MQNKPAKTHIGSKEVARLILDTGNYEDYTIDFIKEIDGKFKCRLKQPWARAKSGFTFYPSSSQEPLDTKLNAVESCVRHIRTMGQMGEVILEDEEEIIDPNAPIKKRGRKPKTQDPIKEDIKEENIEKVEPQEPPVVDSEIQ